MDINSDSNSYRTEPTVFNSNTNNNTNSNTDSDTNSNTNYNTNSGINCDANSIIRSDNAYKVPA